MHLYTVVIICLIGLCVANSRDFPRLATSKPVQHHIHTRSVSNPTVFQAERPDSRCEPVAFKCYEPILSYMDEDGKFCAWKNMTTFGTLPQVCATIQGVSLLKWGISALKYKYKFVKACNKGKIFEKCVLNNQVCSSDLWINSLISDNNIYCNHIQTIMPIITCMNAWDSSVGWYNLMYTDWRIVQACPATHYRQLALNVMKLFLFSYISSPSSLTDAAVQSANAEATGRYFCQQLQQVLCFAKREDQVCPGSLPLSASQSCNDKQLIGQCQMFTHNGGKCNAFVKMNCPVNISTGHMTVNIDFQDITDVYNMTYWHAVANTDIDILLRTENKGIGHCDAGNLVFKQVGCFHQYMTQMDINHANQSNYLTKYMCSNIKLYNSCFEAYISSSCPDEAKEFQHIGSLLNAQCNILRVANTNVTCPLLAIYSGLVYNQESWFELIMQLMQYYIAVIKYKQINLASSGWRDLFRYNADLYITNYKSMLIKGEQINSAVYYENAIISTVCDQEAADVYNDFATLSTGKHFYQLINHLIKGFKYIKYLVQ